MGELIIPRASHGYNIDVTLQDGSGNIFNVSGYTPGVRVWKAGTPDSVHLSAACTIQVATSGTITWNISSGAFMSGDQRYEAIIVATISGVRETFEGFAVRIEEGPAT